MDDLTDQIRAWADATAPPDGPRVEASDIIDGHRAPEPAEPLPHPSRRSQRRFLAAAAVIAVIGAGVTASGVGREDQAVEVVADRPVDGSVEAPADPPDEQGQPVSVHFELSSRMVAGGSTITGRVVVDNDSGRALDGSTCGPFFAVVLESPTASQERIRLACREGFSIPTGRSTYPVTVYTTYSSCSASEPPSATMLACPADGSPPTLPPGEYEAILDQPAGSVLVPTPDPISVRVTARR